MAKICIVEDSEEVASVLTHALAIRHNVEIFKTMAEARAAIPKQEFKLIILDIGLPDGDGLRLCAEIKCQEKLKRIPIFILTGKTSIHEKTLGFQLGIDDFISKPFDPIEVLLRVDAILKKRSEDSEESSELSFGNLRINIASQQVGILISSSLYIVSLSSKEFGILIFLAKHPDQIKSRNTILSVVWGNNTHVTDRTVDSHISRLRKKLEKSNIHIEAIANVGYRLSLIRTGDVFFSTTSTGQ